ncbi:GYD domain-containing protein [Geomonas sp. RF6]|uniref:GYD domain-containing protein n=1 Tax=Geomonas sp. RF6 TaxID=2897342 RepID=UPI001E2F640C|nr:GYD domain-containing protein [Geomonas sp. RF6]UFS69192.1 GYD domain-containing protein [Geomonas sp. RF6]
MMFIMLTRLAPEALRSPASLEQLEKKAAEQIRSKCPKVEWVHNFALLGPYDYLDIFNAPDLETAMEVSTIVRTFGQATTEVWTATEWSKYKELVRNLPQQ